MGKRSNFTDEQNLALREALAAYAKRHGDPSDEKLAAAINAAYGEAVTSQQSLNSFRNGRTGLDYSTATGITQLVAACGVDEFFRQRGLYLRTSGKTDKYVERATAVNIARTLGVREDVIALFQAREGGEVASWRTRRWVDEMLAESDRRVAEDLERLRQENERLRTRRSESSEPPRPKPKRAHARTGTDG